MSHSLFHVSGDEGKGLALNFLQDGEHLVIRCDLDLTKREIVHPEPVSTVGTEEIKSPEVKLKRSISPEQVRKPSDAGDTEDDDDKPFICQTCGKAFSIKYRLQRHELSHSKIKPYECPNCGKAFARTDHMKMHIKTHSGEKPYVCSGCGKNFRARYSLVNHQLKCQEETDEEDQDSEP